MPRRKCQQNLHRLKEQVASVILDSITCCHFYRATIRTAQICHNKSSVRPSVTLR